MFPEEIADMTVYIAAWSVWAPGLEPDENWNSWFDSGANLENPGATPPLAHVDAMFKRRLSQLTRMTIQAGHDALAGQPPMKITFSSVYGEIRQQFKITERMIDDGEVSPAHFSLSVFNTPVAALSITEKNAEGYTACYPGPDAFAEGLRDAASGILAGLEERRLFICADEQIPELYTEISDLPCIPHAVALVLSRTNEGDMLPLPLEILERYRAHTSAAEQLPPALRFARDILCTRQKQTGYSQKARQAHA